MQSQEIHSGHEIFEITISGQLMFLVEAFSKNSDDGSFRDYYHYSLLCGCIADLYNFNKFKLVDNRLVFTSKEPTQIGYLDRFMREITTVDSNKTIFDILMETNEEKMVEIKSNIKNYLMERNLLKEKREGFLVFGKKITLPVNNEIPMKMLENLRQALDSNQDPNEKMIYLLTLLKEIDFLPLLYESIKELDFAEKRLEQIIENKHIAKMISRAIENEMKLRDLRNMPKQKGSSFGMGGGRL